jgi:hypothetical protein
MSVDGEWGHWIVEGVFRVFCDCGGHFMDLVGNVVEHFDPPPSQQQRCWDERDPVHAVVAVLLDDRRDPAAATAVKASCHRRHVRDSIATDARFIDKNARIGGGRRRRCGAP